MANTYIPHAWHWLVLSDGRYWSSADRAYSDTVPERFTRIATEAELREVLALAGYADRAPGYVPASVTMAQARVALRRAGLLDAVTAAVAAAGGEAQDAWEYSPTVGRGSLLVTTLSAALGLTTQQVDGLFRTAAEITF